LDEIKKGSKISWDCPFNALSITLFPPPRVHTKIHKVLREKTSKFDIAIQLEHFCKIFRYEPFNKVRKTLFRLFYKILVRFLMI